MSIFKCDYSKSEHDCCGRLPFAEIYPFKKDEKGEWKSCGSWYYLCLKHFLIMRIRGFLGKAKFGWCRVDSLRESLEELKEEIENVQSDLYDIREALGIVEEVELNEETIKGYG